ncbi:MAG: ATP-binding protein, partial [Chloroflexota bacterium]
GLMIAVYFPMLQTTRWFAEDYQYAHQALEEARDRKGELEQALKDLAQANRELILLTEKLAAARRSAEQAHEAKATFVAKISHEFRTPLNMIIGLIDTLTETPEVYGPDIPPGLLKDLEIVYRNSTHLAGMINDVLDLSQTETASFTLHREQADLAADVESALVVVKPLLEKKKLTLQTLIPTDLPSVYYDRTRIRQVILNLVSNAARYTDQGGLTVEVKAQPQHVVVSIADTGPGIAPEDTTRIFAPFYQNLDLSQHHPGGSGLGLSVSKQLIELHGGKIWVESEVGAGSTFYFELPLALPSPLSSGPERWVSEDWVFRGRTSWPGISPLPARPRVILYDEAAVLYPLFSRYADEIEFVESHNLPQTLQELQHSPAYALVINLAAPTSHLTDLVEQARLTLPDTPIIGCTLPSPKKRALELGAIDYLIKPVTQANLETALQAVGRPICRVLIVDDDPDIGQLFARLLHIRNEALEIITAENGQQALEMTRRHRPDLVLLDIVMPGMDGWQILADKQLDETIKHIPVILVSAEDLVTRPVHSPVMLTTMGPGLSPYQLLEGALKFSALLLKLEPKPGLAPG